MMGSVNMDTAFCLLGLPLIIFICIFYSQVLSMSLIMWTLLYSCEENEERLQVSRYATVICDADSIREDQTTMGVTAVGKTAARGITATVGGTAAHDITATVGETAVHDITATVGATTVAQTTEACTKGLPTGCRSNTSQELRQLKKLLSDMKCNYILEDREKLLASDVRDGYFKDQLSAEVTLAQLQNLDGTDVRIIDTVAAEWRNVAYALKFDDHVIKAIEKSKCRCEDACRDMFNRWINGVGTQPHTWIALAEALKTARYSHIAEQVLNWLLGKHTPSGSAKEYEDAVKLLETSKIPTKEEVQLKSKEELEDIVMTTEHQLQTLQNRFHNIVHKRDKELVMVRQQLISQQRLTESSKVTESKHLASGADKQQSSSAGSDTLEPRLEDLQHLVKMYPEKWRAFGRQLNIDPEMLDIIWKESNRNPEDAFNQVLLIWKSRKTVPYTWCTMCDILETHEVGCSSLSYDIKSKKWTPQQQAIKLHELYSIEGTDIRVMDEVTPHWEDVAVALKLDGNMIDTVKRDMYGDASHGCRLMFEKWLNGAGSQPPTWDTLVAALYEAKLNTVAHKIETELRAHTSGASSADSTSPSSIKQLNAMQSFATSVKGNANHSGQGDEVFDEQLFKEMEKSMKQLQKQFSNFRKRRGHPSSGQTDEADGSWMDEMKVPSPGTGIEELILKYKTLQDHHQKLRPIVDDIICEIAICNSDMEAVKENNEKIKKGERFSLTKKEVKLCKIPLKLDEYVTNCDVCQTTCHYPCGIKNDEGKIGCSAMSNGKCTACRGKCSWTRHTNNTCRYEYQECEVKTTMGDLFAKYKLGGNSGGDAERGIQQHKQQLEHKQFALMGQLRFIDTTKKQVSEQLQSAIQFFNTQIDNEHQLKRPGYLDRIKVLEQQRNRAMDYS